jgi:hypothetical protein
MRAFGNSISILVLASTCVAVLASDGKAASIEPGKTRHDFVDGSYPNLFYGGPVEPTKTESDSLYLLGGPDRSDGKFQDDSDPTLPDPEGWVGWVNYGSGPAVFWHVDTFNAALLDDVYVPNHAMWCGTYFYDCDPGGDPGYGNNWNEALEWYGTVSDESQPSEVHLTARLNYDTEPYYDNLYLEVYRVSGWNIVQSYDGNNKVGGVFVPIDVDETFSVDPFDYTGPFSDQVRLRWRFEADGAWSDEDCQMDTDGAAQLDNILVTLTQSSTTTTYDDFEPGSDVHWDAVAVDGICSYAQVWPLLDDIDPCHTNTTPQFAFIDDGSICGGPGSPCINWCYGPGGYVIHYEPYPTDWLWQDQIWSPPLAWPGGTYDGAMLSFDVYRHLASGQFYTWAIRSSLDGGNTWQEWQDSNFAYYSSQAGYYRHDFNVSNLLAPTRTHIQISLGYYWLGWVWGSGYDDLTPAPYFDNVAFKVFANEGPVVLAGALDLAQDSFPASGTFDFDDPASNSIRFDMARNIAPPYAMLNDPGDSIVVDVVPVRGGSVLNDMPKLYYKLWPNPLFDPYRTFSNEGWVYGDTTYASNGAVVENRYNFDLPDTGFFFPGDVIQYYITAQDNVGGDVGTTLLPSDTTGFSGPPRWPHYNSAFRVQGLPSLFSLTEGDQPRILFWNDYADSRGENEWYYAWYNLGYQPGIDFDVYYTNGPSGGAGNGLGGRATTAQLAGYQTVVYSCGDLSHATISNGDFEYDAGDDVGVLDSWLRLGNKNMFLTGNDLIYDLTQHGGPATQAFVTDWMGVDFIDEDVRPMISNQSAPLVQPVPGNSLDLSVTDWLAYGSCPTFKTFDAVTAAGTSERVAEFLDPNGASGMYFYSAMTYHHDAAYDANIVSLPYDLMFVLTSSGSQGSPHPSASRTRLLSDVLIFFGVPGTGSPLDVPADAGKLHAWNFPNPFNPSTKIAYHLPRRGELTITIYNLRGKRVRTLLEEVVPAGPGAAIWDGNDDHGEAVASGVYFYELRTLDQSTIHKMALIK